MAPKMIFNSLMVFLVTLIGVSNAIPADNRWIPTGPSFMQWRWCPDKKPIADCYRQGTGRYYSGEPDVPISETKDTVDSDMDASLDHAVVEHDAAAVTGAPTIDTSDDQDSAPSPNPASTLVKRHDYLLNCKDSRRITEYCRSVGYFCDKVGRLRRSSDATDQDCERNCGCQKLASQVMLPEGPPGCVNCFPNSWKAAEHVDEDGKATADDVDKAEAEEEDGDRDGEHDDGQEDEEDGGDTDEDIKENNGGEMDKSGDDAVKDDFDHEKGESG